MLVIGEFLFVLWWVSVCPVVSFCLSCGEFLFVLWWVSVCPVVSFCLSCGEFLFVLWWVYVCPVVSLCLSCTWWVYLCPVLRFCLSCGEFIFERWWVASPPVVRLDPHASADSCTTWRESSTRTPAAPRAMADVQWTKINNHINPLRIFTSIQPPAWGQPAGRHSSAYATNRLWAMTAQTCTKHGIWLFTTLFMSTCIIAEYYTGLRLGGMASCNFLGWLKLGLEWLKLVGVAETGLVAERSWMGI